MWQRALGVVAVRDALDIDNHFFVNVGVGHHLAELLEVDLPVLVLVGEENGLVDNLLELSVFQIGADHHFQHLEQLAVADEPVIVNIVNSKKE